MAEGRLQRLLFHGHRRSGGNGADRYQRAAPLPRADLRCLDPATGNELWKKENLGYFHFAVMSVADGKVLILDDGGNLLLAEVTRKGYRELAKSKVCHGTFNCPALANGRLFVRDNAEVICLDLSAPATKAATTAAKTP